MLRLFLNALLNYTIQVAFEVVEENLELSAPFSDLDSLVRKELQKKQQVTSLKGFRPGKVPLEIIKRLYGEDVLEECVQRKFLDLLENYRRKNQILAIVPSETSYEIKDNSINFKAKITTLVGVRIEDYLTPLSVNEYFSNVDLEVVKDFLAIRRGENLEANSSEVGEDSLVILSVSGSENIVFEVFPSLFDPLMDSLHKQLLRKTLNDEVLFRWDDNRELTFKVRRIEGFRKATIDDEEARLFLANFLESLNLREKKQLLFSKLQDFLLEIVNSGKLDAFFALTNISNNTDSKVYFLLELLTTSFFESGEVKLDKDEFKIFFDTYCMRHGINPNLSSNPEEFQQLIRLASNTFKLELVLKHLAQELSFEVTKTELSAAEFLELSGYVSLKQSLEHLFTS